MKTLEIKQIKIYQKNWFILLMLFLFFPVGLFLLWKYSTYKKRAKLIITAIVASIVIFGAAQGNKQQQQTTQQEPINQNSTEKMQESKELPAYEVTNIEQRTPDTVTYQVIVNEPANVEQIKQIGKAIILKAEETGKVPKLIIFFNDQKEYIGHGAALGRIEYDGSWPLEYIGKEKDWSKRLTTEEVQIWSQCYAYLKKQHTLNDINDDTPLIKEFAAQHHLDAEKVHAIMIKQLSWHNQ